MEGEDDRLVGGEEAIEIFVVEAVRMLVEGFERQEVDDVDDADAQVGRPVAQQGDGGEGFQRGHIAAAGHHDFGIAVVVGGPLPDAKARGAVLRRLLPC